MITRIWNTDGKMCNDLTWNDPHVYVHVCEHVHVCVHVWVYLCVRGAMCECIYVCAVQCVSVFMCVRCMTLVLIYLPNRIIAPGYRWLCTRLCQRPHISPLHSGRTRDRFQVLQRFVVWGAYHQPSAWKACCRFHLCDVWGVTLFTQEHTSHKLNESVV